MDKLYVIQRLKSIGNVIRYDYGDYADKVELYQIADWIEKNLFPIEGLPEEKNYESKRT